MTTLRTGIALAAAMAAAVGSIASTNAVAEVPLGYCGNGFELVYDVALEALLANAQQDNVNFDGYVCINSSPSNGGREFVIIVDNNRKKPPR